MQTLNVRSYEIKNARNKERIPVVNGVHLHSSYDPSKEAMSFVERHAETLQKKNEVLILGLGFGYHVNEIARILKEIHGKKFSIVVIEPNNEIYKDCIKEGLLNTDNVTIYTGAVAKDFYNHGELTQFLLRKPAVIAHPSSFNLYQAFFKSFLSYEAPKTFGKMNTSACPPEIKVYLSKFSADENLDQAADTTFQKNAKLEELDFLLLALRAMTSRLEKDNQRSGDN
jgi:hypothetical protein